MKDFTALILFSAFSASAAFFLALLLGAITLNYLTLPNKTTQRLRRWSLLLLFINLIANLLFHLYLIANQAALYLETGDVAVTRRIPTYTELLSLVVFIGIKFHKKDQRLSIFVIAFLFVLGIGILCGGITLLAFASGWVQGYMLAELSLWMAFMLPICILYFWKDRLQRKFRNLNINNLLVLSVICLLTLLFHWSALFLQVLSSGGLG